MRGGEAPSDKGVFAVFLALALCLTGYFFSLPQFVQGGDTGELVAAGYGLYVPHPPGYPMWVLLQHVFIHAVPFGTVFWKASALSALAACGALLAVGWPLARDASAAFGCMLLLALSSAFAGAALLPDVFSLHALFVAAVGSIYLFSGRESTAFRFWVPLLFFLGLAHHLTTVLMLPAVVGVFYELRTSREGLRRAALGAALGALGAALLYGSLLSFHPNAGFSWGGLGGFTSVWRHFLRVEYGVFSLSPTGNARALDGLGFFLRNSWIELCGLIGIAAISIRGNRWLLRETRALFWAGACVVSLAFLAFSNVDPVRSGKEVLVRFHVMPLVQLTLLAGFAWVNGRSTPRDRRILTVFVGLVVIVSGYRSANLVGLRRDSVIEDYASNLLSLAGRRAPSIVVEDDDSAYFAMRYLQAVKGEGKSVTVVSPGLFFTSWYLAHVRLSAPGFQLPGDERIRGRRQLSLDKDLIEPNLGSYSVIVPRGYGDGRGFHTTFMGIGRLLGSGSGLAFDDASTREIAIGTRMTVERAGGSQFFSKAALFAQYSHFYLARGRSYYIQGERDLARRDWEQALDLVPYAFPALENICSLGGGTDPRCSKERLARMKELADGLF